MSREDAARPLLQGAGQKSRGQEAGVDQKSPQMSSLPALPAVNLGPALRSGQPLPPLPRSSPQRSATRPDSPLPAGFTRLWLRHSLFPAEFTVDASGVGWA